MNRNDLKQPDSQIMSISETMGVAEEVMGEHGCETLLVINLGRGHSDALLGGAISLDAIGKMDRLLQELRSRIVSDTHDPMHVWISG